MLEYNEVRPGTFVVLDDEPYECLSAHIFRKQQRKPVNAAKLKNLKTAKVIEYSFAQSEKVAEAELKTRPAKFLYAHRGEFWFSEPSDPGKRFKLEENLLDGKTNFLKANSLVDRIFFGDEIIGIKLPIKVDLRVTEAPPDFRGNTAQGGSKIVTLETGAELNVPMFVKEGDTIRVNTETGDYVERV